ncbi:MAG: prepilin-type N-terminal cleavage/methylation domain-containing protein [Gemmatimonadota bacterium]
MSRDGFTLVEVIIGMMILVIAAVALAGSTGYVGMQLQASDLRTNRQMARQQVIEELHAVPFDNVTTLAQGSATSRDGFDIWWDVSAVRWALKEVAVYTEGPGFSNGRFQRTVRDTVEVRIARPN